MIIDILNYLKRNIMLPLILPLALATGYADTPTIERPYENLTYTKERSHATTVHKVAVGWPYSLELVINQDGRKGLDRLSRMCGRLEEKEGKNALVAVNGSYFDPPTRRVIGTLIYRRMRLINEKWDRAQIGIEDWKAPEFGYFFRADGASFDYLLTGGPYLVNNGENIVSTSIESERFSKQKNRPNPRTGIGKRADGTVVMIVADGRREAERGLSLDELAELFINEKCEQAINLDGGGSSTMVLSGEFYGREKTENIVANNPSDGHERAVANGIVVVQQEKK
ncbi:MAG: phosphodiester glycosidase family protein [Nanoarchaeota archaeon]